jgi:NADPH:quinone reductase-like Zn-dependent oxidoreductase
MRALELSAYEGLRALTLVEKPVPEPKPGQVLIKVAAAALNPSDLMFVRGLYGFTKSLPTVPGFEASGRVVAGSGAYARLLIGRRVACGVQRVGDGTWAEYVVTDAMTCLPLLPCVSLEQGATLLVNPLYRLGARRGS